MRVTVKPTLITLEIADDGRGLSTGSSGIGLDTMKERAAEIGGTREIGSATGSGTRPGRLCRGWRRRPDERPPIRILIADDDPLFRGGLRALLDSVSDTEVVGEAATGEEAVAAAISLIPMSWSWNINMPGLNGSIDATRRVVDETENVTCS